MDRRAVTESYLSRSYPQRQTWQIRQSISSPRRLIAKDDLVNDTTTDRKLQDDLVNWTNDRNKSRNDEPTELLQATSLNNRQGEVRNTKSAIAPRQHKTISSTTTTTDRTEDGTESCYRGERAVVRAIEANEPWYEP